MQEKLLSIDTFYKREYDYMLEELKKHSFTYAPSERGSRLELYVAITDDEERRRLFSIVEEVFLTSMKWRYYTEKLNIIADTVDQALLYTLLDFDSIGERRYIYENIFPNPQIHIDALYNFSLSEVKSAWSGYVELLKDFYQSLPNEEEKCELIGYMYTMNGKNRIKRRGRLYLSGDGEKMLLQKVFYYREKIADEVDKYEGVKKIVKKIFA